MSKIKVGIASLVERKEQLIKTLDSLVDQVDEIHVCLNNYLETPYEHEKVTFFYSDNVFTDSGKFLGCQHGYEGYYFGMDDDLVVGETYIEDTIKMIDLYGVVSYHGRGFANYPIMSYYRNAAYRCRCLDDYHFTEPMDIIGTGCLGFHTKFINPPMSIFKTPRMADIYFSIYAHEQGVHPWVLKHNKGYIKYQDIPQEETIWYQKKDSCEVETRVINNYFTNK